MNNGTDKPAAWLIGAVSTTALLLSAVGIGTGEVPRVLRNHPWLAGATFILVVLGSLTGATGAWHVRARSRGQSTTRGHTELAVGATMLALAAGLAVVTGIVSATEHPAPGITTAIVVNHQGREVLHFGVKASGLKSAQKLAIRVTAVTFIAKTASSGSTVFRTPLYVESLGPNSAGEINQQAEVLVPPAPANDLEVQAGTGTLPQCYRAYEPAAAAQPPNCSRLHIVRPFEKPQLTIAWRNDRHSQAGLFVHVSAHDLGEHRIVLRIVDALSHHLIIATSWPPTETGLISKSITAIVPASTQRLCVAASTTQTTPSCFPPAGSGTAFVREVAPAP